MNAPRLGSEWVIYALADPASEEVRYIGCTSLEPPELRLRHHLTRSVKLRSHLGNWLRQLVSRGVLPTFAVVERGKGDGWSAAERKWIGLLPNLVNQTAGGEGLNLTNSSIGSEATRSKIGAKTKARLADPAQRQRLSEARKADWENPEYRARMLAVIKAQAERDRPYAATAAFREQCRQISLLKFEDPAYCQLISQRRKETWRDPEYRRLKSEQALKQWEAGRFGRPLIKPPSESLRKKET